MFRILCDPSSGSTELCLTEIIHGDSQIFLSCAWSVFGNVILNQWCVCVRARECVRVRYGRPHRTHTHHRFKITLPNTDQAHDKNICESP